MPLNNTTFSYLRQMYIARRHTIKQQNKLLFYGCGIRCRKFSKQEKALNNCTFSYLRQMFIARRHTIKQRNKLLLYGCGIRCRKFSKQEKALAC